MPHELVGYKRDDYEGVQLSLMAYNILKGKQKDYADSNKAKIDTRRSKVGYRPNAKKGIKHTKRG